MFDEFGHGRNTGSVFKRRIFKRFQLELASKTDRPGRRRGPLSGVDLPQRVGPDPPLVTLR
jgi:hypothetical protein